MKFLPSFAEFVFKGVQTFKRFPITLVSAIVGTFFMIYWTEINFSDNIFFGKVIITFTLSISWFIATRFFIEQLKPKKQWVVLFLIVFLFIFYWHLPNDIKKINLKVYWLRFLLYFLAGHLFVFTTPFILKWKKETYFNYIKSVFIAIVRSTFFSSILCFGIILAFLAIKYLLDVNINEKRFIQIAIICYGIVNTWIYLSDFEKDIHKQITINYTKALEVLVKYILIPLLILYLIILYAYSLKIIILWNLPKGWVSYLIVILSFLGFIIQMLINPIQKTIKSRGINRFSPWFYILLLPLIFLLFVAIFRRILEYGFTENRYFILVLAIWIFGMTLYMLFNKKKKINYFPLTLGIIIMVVSVGFWGVFSVSEKSQLNQFSKVFNQIKKKKFMIPSKKKEQLISIIRYLSERNKLAKIEPTLGYNPVLVFGKKNTIKLIDSLNIKVTNRKNDKNWKYYYIEKEKYTFNIQDYTYFKKVSFSNEDFFFISNYTFILNEKTNNITITNKKNKDFLYFINLNSFIKNLTSKSEINLTPPKMSIEKTVDSLKIKLIFTSINLKKRQNKSPLYKIDYGSAYILIKENAQ